jgi:hypothetical protein
MVYTLSQRLNNVYVPLSIHGCLKQHFLEEVGADSSGAREGDEIAARVRVYPQEVDVL